MKTSDCLKRIKSKKLSPKAWDYLFNDYVKKYPDVNTAAYWIRENNQILDDKERELLTNELESCVMKDLKVGDKVKRNSLPFIASRDTEVPNNSQGVIEKIDGINYTVNFDGDTRVLKVKELIKVSQGGGKKRKSKRKYTRKKKKKSKRKYKRKSTKNR